MAQDLISKKTRNEFRELLVGWTLRKISNEFDAARVPCDSSHAPDVTGQRRSLVEQYYHAVDFTDPLQVEKVEHAYEYILNKVEVDIREASNEGDKSAYQKSLANLLHWLNRDGYEYKDGRLIRPDVPVGVRRNYRLERVPIGEGGQAKVFRAVHKRSGEHVAFKRLEGKRLHDAGRFRREIDLLKSLNHPNIMPIYETSEDLSWYTMPIARGDLFELRSGLSETRHLVRVIRDVARGLLAAHELGICHRDVTPRNVLLLLEPTKRWVISDFGTARRPLGETTTRRTSTGHFIGIEGFAAPETWVDAHNMDERADIYSLGRIVAWAESGIVPAPNIPLVPEGCWSDFVRRTTALESSDRPSSMTNILEMLNEIE